MTEKPVSFPIKNWSQDDQPREKLRDKGKSTLSDAELVAILIGSGNRQESAVALSKRILASVNYNLNELGKLSLKQLMVFKGMGYVAQLFPIQKKMSLASNEIALCVYYHLC